MIRRILVLVAIALLAFAASASADHGSVLNDTAVAVEGKVDEVTGVLDDVNGTVDKADPGVGDTLRSVGAAVGDFFSAVGRIALDGIEGLADASGALAGGLATGLLVSLEGTGVALGAIGSGITGIVAFAGTGLAVIGGWIGAGVGSLIAGYIDLVGLLRPERMPVAVFGTVAVTGTATSAGVGGWAGWNALRRWGWLGSLGGMAGFTRIQADQMLDHPLRNHMFQSIQQHPGIHASQLVRELDAGWGTVTHHLDKLERARLVTTRRVNNQKCYFENGGKVSRNDMAALGALKGDTASNIAAYVNSHPMTSQKGLAEALGISAALASFHVKKLVNLGVLDKVRHGKEMLLTTSEAMRRLAASEAEPALGAVLSREENLEFSS